MTGFELQTSSVGSDHSTNGAIPFFVYILVVKLQLWLGGSGNYFDFPGN